MSPHDFAMLLDTHGPPLVLYARQWCDTPEDVVQDAFLKLLALRQPPREVVPWLYQVVRHRAIDATRGAARRQRREAAVRPARWFVEPELDGLDAAAAVAALEGLPMEQREAIVARLWGGLSFEQIAAIAGCSAGSAFRRFSAGIDALRHTMGVPMSESFPERLSRFTPDGTGLDRDALLFAAGRASARPSRLWAALAGTLAASQLLTLGMLCWPTTTLPSKSTVTPMIVDRAPPAPASEEASIWSLRDLDFATESAPPRTAPIANLVADEPPMHAFGTLPPALLN